MQCIDCKTENNHQFSLWDRIRIFFFYRFSKEIKDLGDDKYTKGFGEGYKQGFEHCKEFNRLTK